MVTSELAQVLNGPKISAVASSSIKTVTDAETGRQGPV